MVTAVECNLRVKSPIENPSPKFQTKTPELFIQILNRKKIHQNFKTEANHPPNTSNRKAPQNFETFTNNFNTQGQHSSLKKIPESKNLTSL